MISKKAIEAFLERDLDNFQWIKKESKSDLMDAIAELPVNHIFHTDPFKHQAAAFYIGTCLSNFLFFLDMGAGKTHLALNLAKYYMKMNEVQKVLVIVPNVLNVAGWKEEMELHTPTLKHVGIYGGSAKDRLKMLDEEEGDIYVINYDGLQTVMSSFMEVKGKTPSGKKKKKRQIDPALVKRLTEKFQMVVFDEVHNAKNSQTLTYKLCKQISKKCKYRYGLTGTPFGRDPEDLWAEFNLVDEGETLGNTLGIYRGAFFDAKSSTFWNQRYKREVYVVSYEFKKKMQRQLNRMIQNRSIRYEDKEFEDLPLKIETNIPLKMSSDANAYYQELAKESREQKKDETAVRVAYYAKWRQICSGFVYQNIEDDELGKTKLAIEFSSSEKLDAMEILLEDMPTDSKMVIFHVYNKTGEMIVKRLKKLKISYGAVNSTSDDKVKDYEKFKKDPKCRVFVVNYGSGNAGLNLQNANYVIMYEPVDRPIWYKQAMKRVFRTGQKKRTYFYHFHVERSVEDKVLGFIKEGKSLFDALIEGKVSMKDIS